MRHKGLRTLFLATPPHPPMHDGEALSFAILMADALSRLTTNGIDAVKAVGAQGPPHPLPVRVCG